MTEGSTFSSHKIRDKKDDQIKFLFFLIYFFTVVIQVLLYEIYYTGQYMKMYRREYNEFWLPFKDLLCRVVKEEKERSNLICIPS